MADRGWKKAEREIARLLGGRRIPVSDRARGEAPDIDHPTLSIEVKARTSTPAWLEEALQQARASSREGKVPVAVLHTAGRPYKDALCVMSLEDLAALTRPDRGGESYHSEGRPPYLTQGPTEPKFGAKFGEGGSSGR